MHHSHTSTALLLPQLSGNSGVGNHTGGRKGGGQGRGGGGQTIAVTLLGRDGCSLSVPAC
jgi:hypothetical protein